jgi:hypothetical protein
VSVEAGEARAPRQREIESLLAEHEDESPADTARMMEEIGKREICRKPSGRFKYFRSRGLASLFGRC